MDVQIVGSGGEEDAPSAGETAQAYVKRLSLVKARYARSAVGDAVILGADTSVALNGEIMGKPVDDADAFRMLRALRGRPHKVVTGVTVLDAASGEWAAAARASDVYMRNYSDSEIAAYVATGRHRDKAGAYAAQDETFKPASRIEGCYLNVVGLPLCDVLMLLDHMGVAGRLRPDWQMPHGCLDCMRWAVAYSPNPIPNEQVNVP